jgi:preprotein translocase subunit SecD
MMSISRWKVIAVVLAAVVGLLFSLPNMIPAQTLAGLPGWVPQKRLNLGLDLQGGSYLLLEVDTAALRRERLSTSEKRLASPFETTRSKSKTPPRPTV